MLEWMFLICDLAQSDEGDKEPYQANEGRPLFCMYIKVKVVRMSVILVAIGG